jgi:DHA2 family multidrug resistance protein-like MFS transporter
MKKTTPSGTGPRAGRREWTGLAVLALPTLLVSLDVGALFLALPSLTADLGASSVEQLWITDIYGFMIAGFLVTMGTLGDRIGRRRLLLIGAAAFGVASVAAAYSTSPEMLIATRALLGVAGATLMPSTLALIRNMFKDPKQMGTAIALWMSCMTAGAALGPVIGGMMLQFFWWGSVFLLGVPVMLLLLVTGPALLPEHRDPNAGRLDLVSVLLSLAAILPLIYGLKELAIYGFSSTAGPVVVIVAGLVFGALFVRRQLTLADPLLDLRLFSSPSFSVALTAMLLASGSMAGTFLLVSQYLQTVLGLSPAQAGLWLAPAGLSIAVGSMVAPALARRVRPGIVMSAGLAAGVIGFVMISQVESGGGLGLAVAGVSLLHLGAGPLFALGTGLVMGSVLPEKAGAAASISETSSNFGSTLGIAALGTVGTAVYRLQMTGPAPEGIPAGALQAAQENAAAATVAARGLPEGPAAELLRTAGESFTAGLNTGAVVGGVVFAILAVLIGRTFRASGEAAGTAEADSSVGELSAG